MSWDPYAILGVPRTATADEIKKSYRKLAKELHPDTRPNDKASEERFKRVARANDLLSDPAQRARFDRGEIDAEGQERHPGFEGGWPGGRPGAGRPGASGRAGETVFDFSEMFGDIFSQGGARTGRPGQGPGPGPGPGSGQGSGPRQDPFGGAPPFGTRFRLDVDFIDAATGANRRVSLGDGRSVDLDIPAGAETGAILRGRGASDVSFEISVREHAWFRREGNAIHMDLPVSFVEAIEGAKVQVPTVNGPVVLLVPAGSTTGTVLRLRGKGVQSKPPGDQLVRLEVMTPEAKDPELLAFLARWGGRNWKPRRPE